MKPLIRSDIITWISRIAAVSALWLSLAPAPASAVPLLWTLDNVTFNGGGTATGSFLFDADTASYSNISVTTAGGGSLDAGFDILGGGSAAGANFLNSADGPDFSDSPTLRLVFLDLLTNAGGVVGLQLNDFSSGAAGCFNADCTILLSGIANQFASGSVIGEAVAQVSEPGTLMLFAVPLLAFALARRRSDLSRFLRRAANRPA
ncbi:hypothetical protein [Pelagibius sp. Alg239-R121]|uniref:hypothetical protein n=1 Tax=Pelagibius sp. Alg239-R121 TaxID=2993448 RepID=UPI0024A6DC73|nr:hypothetical protein [Pelagibius sp. Alg239-R121]